MSDFALAVNVGHHGDQRAWKRLQEPEQQGNRDVGKIKTLAKSLRKRQSNGGKK